MSDPSVDLSTPESTSKLATLKATAHQAVDDSTNAERLLASINLLWGQAQPEPENKPKIKHRRSTQFDALGILIRQSMNDPNKVTWTLEELYNAHRASPSMPQGEERGQKRINELLTRASAHTFIRVPGDDSRWLLRKRWHDLTKPAK